MNIENEKMLTVSSISDLICRVILTKNFPFKDLKLSNDMIQLGGLMSTALETTSVQCNKEK